MNASYALDRWLWSYQPLGYHLTNVALHALVVVLFTAWIQRVLSDTTSDADASLPAFTGAALFAVHPIQSEAVAYVSGRSEVLSAVWFIGALLSARGAICLEVSRERWWLWFAGFSRWRRRKRLLRSPSFCLRTTSFSSWRRRGPREEAVGAPDSVLAVFAVAGAYRLLAMTGSSIGSMRPILNALTQAIVIWRYVALIVWPSGQTVMHSVHHVTRLADPLAWMAVAGLVLVGILGFRLRRSNPVTVLGLIWFLAVLAPSSSFSPAS